MRPVDSPALPQTSTRIRHSQPQIAAAARTHPHTRQPAPIGDTRGSQQFKAQFSLM
jgi:hypothetical protein